VLFVILLLYIVVSHKPKLVQLFIAEKLVAQQIL